MIRVFRHYIPKSVFVLGIIECAALFVAIWVAMHVRFAQIGIGTPAFGDHLIEIFSFVGIVYMSMLAAGLYELETCRDLRVTLIRLIASLVISVVVMSVVFYLIPNVDIWRSVIILSLAFSIIFILLSRYLFSKVVNLKRFNKRVLVLGAGTRAAKVRSLAKDEKAAVTFVGFLRMGETENAIAEAIDYEAIPSLAAFINEKAAEEIVIAIEERRGTLPVEDLLDCRMNGCAVVDGPSFIEQQTGAVNLASINPSWLIFSDGFGGGKEYELLMKRVFDITVSLLLLVLSMPVLIVTGLLIIATSKGPMFYRQERVGLNGKPFQVMKFRSMRTDAEIAGKPQWAKKNDDRVTTIGRIIRTTRIDEIPQIVNVLRGDMSFVGPRPERPYFVDQLSQDIPYFSERHRVKPGITGWAQINYPYGASVEDSRRKLEYDLYYIKNYSLFLDFLILIQTVRVVLWPDGVR